MKSILDIFALGRNRKEGEGQVRIGELVD